MSLLASESSNLLQEAYTRYEEIDDMRDQQKEVGKLEWNNNPKTLGTVPCCATMCVRLSPKRKSRMKNISKII